MSRDEKLLAAQQGIGGNVDIWDMATGKKLTELAAHAVSISALAFSADGRWLLTAGAETPATARDQAGNFVAAWGVKVWNVGTWTERLHQSFSGTSAPCATFSPDSHQLAVQKAWELIELLDVDRGTLLGTFIAKDRQPQNHQFSLGNLAFSPDGALLLQGAQNGIRVWKLQNRPENP
jgi:WD40 repeat protein